MSEYIKAKFNLSPVSCVCECHGRMFAASGNCIWELVSQDGHEVWKQMDFYRMKDDRHDD